MRPVERSTGVNMRRGLEVGLGAGDEEASGIIEVRQALEVEIAAIHDTE